MLRKIRILLATVMFTLVTLLFLGTGWAFVRYIAWTAKIQFLPALLALNYAVLAVLVTVTLVFGRIYCSIVCPLGIMQDVFAWLGRQKRLKPLGKPNRYGHSPEKRLLRYTVLCVFVVCLLAGFTPLTTLLAPYSAYGRIVSNLLRPLTDLLLNGAASIESHYDSYVFQTADVWMRSVTTFVIALLTFVGIGLLAWRNGRTWCNTVCPVGTLLSFFSRFSLLKIQFDKDKCKNCSRCEKNCKTAAIDFKAGMVDYSRCVVCGDCIEECKFGALSYKASWKSSKTGEPAGSAAEPSRRAFLTGSALAVGSIAMAQTKMKVDGGLAVLEEKKVPHRETPLTPPGSVSGKNMQRHCTACQLCVSVCPNNVLRPSTDPLHLMQPVMSFERGWCRPECTRCSEVCPTGAIRPVTREEKTAIHAGHAVWIQQNCIPVTNGDECGNCARHCPAWAIHMVETNINGKTVRVPSIDPERCIGCGSCEYICPARPFSAIYVEGNKMHRID